ncbi:MAG: IS66 family insertion sequence element accessory protein TnpB [Planctomycetaceae bacterium]
MLNFSAARIYLCLDPTDMRKSFDTLAALVREQLRGDPQSETWFVFRGKQGNRLKILYWDRDGYALWHKKFESHDPHFFSFTEIHADANTGGVRPTAVGRMDSSPTRIGPRKRPMSSPERAIAPPRA